MADSHWLIHLLFQLLGKNGANGFRSLAVEYGAGKAHLFKTYLTKGLGPTYLNFGLPGRNTYQQEQIHTGGFWSARSPLQFNSAEAAEIPYRHSRNVAHCLASLLQKSIYYQ